VNIYSRAEKIRLFLNGKLIDEKVTDSLYTAKFELSYAPGELKAIAVNANKEIDSSLLVTTGRATHLVLKADRKKIHANRNDLSYITVEATDDNGNVVPDANILVHFAIKGAGELAAVGNANPADMASFKQPQRNTFRGKCLVVLRSTTSTGNIILEATAGGLTAAQITIVSK